MLILPKKKSAIFSKNYVILFKLIHHLLSIFSYAGRGNCAGNRRTNQEYAFTRPREGACANAASNCALAPVKKMQKIIDVTELKV